MQTGKIGKARFNMNANTYVEATEYFKNRSIQMKRDYIKLDGTIPFEDLGWGCRAFFVLDSRPGKEQYQSIYVYAAHRGQNKLIKFIEKEEKLSLTPRRFITTPQCRMADFFKKFNVPYTLVARWTELEEYKMIESFYGNRQASRSGVYYMNHIDEGIAVLPRIGTFMSHKAFCLHPLVQRDEDLQENYHLVEKYQTMRPMHVLEVMEYRSVANEYLAHRTDITKPEQIRLSPIDAVNNMLKADKIQNYKDFLLYHKDTHPNAKQLDFYFRNWLERLEVSTNEFSVLKNMLEEP
ncbi:MAG: hypothetical protein WC761_01720 [Candidatus Paceibacterota bacterium]|jgi:hypothetical protein